MSAALGNGNLTFGDGTSQSTAGSLFTIGQSWTNVAASRAYNTNYTNSTGKPIAVLVSQGSGGSAICSDYVGGVAINYYNVPGVSYNQISTIFIVPDGLTYQVANSNGTILQWFELR